MANILNFDDREIHELDEIGRQVPPSLPCGTVVAWDSEREVYIYDPNFGAIGLSHYIRTSHRPMNEGGNSLCWIAIQRDFGFIEACRKVGKSDRR